MTTYSISNPFFVRNLVYGLEDSIISTTGFLLAVKFAGMAIPVISLAGSLLVIVEALSMSFGALVADESFLLQSRTPYTIQDTLFYALTMLVAYLAAGFMLLTPFYLQLKNQYIYTLVMAIISLFLVTRFASRSTQKAMILTIAGCGILGISTVVGFISSSRK